MKKVMESVLNPKQNKNIKIKNTVEGVNKGVMNINCSECETNSENAFYEMQRMESDINMMNIMPYLELPNQNNFFSNSSERNIDPSTENNQNYGKNLYSNEVASIQYNYILNKFI